MTLGIEHAVLVLVKLSRISPILLNRRGTRLQINLLDAAYNFSPGSLHMKILLFGFSCHH